MDHDGNITYEELTEFVYNNGLELNHFESAFRQLEAVDGQFYFLFLWGLGFGYRILGIKCLDIKYVHGKLQLLNPNDWMCLGDADGAMDMDRLVKEFNTWMMNLKFKYENEKKAATQAKIKRKAEKRLRKLKGLDQTDDQPPSSPLDPNEPDGDDFLDSDPISLGRAAKIPAVEVEMLRHDETAATRGSAAES